MGTALALLPRRARVRWRPGPPSASAATSTLRASPAALVVAFLLTALLAPPVAPAAGPFPDAVTDFQVGDLGGFQQGLLPDIVLGGPRGKGAGNGSVDVFSLGRGGWIVLEFRESIIVDGPGVDFTVFENAFLIPSGTAAGPPFAEAARVSVSADGVDFVEFPCAIDDGAALYPGCAGVYPVFANVDDPMAPAATEPTTVPLATLIAAPLPLIPPPGSGGDSFDLADLHLPGARFVRIVSGPGSLPNGGGQAGFDLDAIAAIHWRPAADQDGDGVDDALDNCPQVPNGDQSDADGDGDGDACDANPNEPPPPPGDDEDPPADGGGGDGDGDDADGDGIPDVHDNCRTLPNAPQEDTDADGVGNVCDLCPATGDGVNADSDADGVGDACDPCPDDASCGPLLGPVFVGGDPGRKRELLLTFVTPSGKVTRVPRDTLSVDLWINFGAAVDPGTLRVTIDGAEATALITPVVPASSKRVTLPVGGRRTRVSFRIAGRAPNRGSIHDVDRLVIRRQGK